MNLDSELVKRLEVILKPADIQELIDKLVELAVVELFREGRVDFDSAAELLRIPKREFLYLLCRLRIPYFEPVVRYLQEEAFASQEGEFRGSLDELLNIMLKEKASDIHLKVGSPPVLRVSGKLFPVGKQKLTSSDTMRLVMGAMTRRQQDIFKGKLSLNFAYQLDTGDRFRINAFWERSAISAAIRRVSVTGQSFKELNLPSVLTKFAELKSGLVLIAGPAGSGKSTTLSAIINYINEHRNVHIITIEDPIEFIHYDKKSIISQREVGVDTPSFAEALREALRQDPDVILIGEMRDEETVETAALAAETGHLVFSTIHASNTIQAIERIVDIFSGKRQEQFRHLLANTLRGIVALKLLPRKDSDGRIPAVEVMVVTSTIRSLIAEGKFVDIYQFIREGQTEGMQTFTMSLEKLIHQCIISRESALTQAEDATELRLILEGQIMDGKSTEEGYFNWL